MPTVETSFQSSIDVTNPNPPIQYLAEVKGSVGIRAIDYEAMINSQINVRESIDPVVTYQADIVGLINLGSTRIDDDDIGFPAELKVDDILFNDESGSINGYLQLGSDVSIRDIESTIRVAKVENDYDILYGYLDYQKEFLDVDIPSTMFVRVQDDHFIDGTVDIEYDEAIRDIHSVIEVKDIYFDKDAIDGNCSIFKTGYSINLTNGRFIYEESESENFLDGSVIINAYRSWFDVNCRINVPSHKILYSFFSKMKVVNECTIDIQSEITVVNDQLYDILGELNLEAGSYDDLILEGNMNLPPYYYCDIQSTVNMDPIFTRRDFDCYLYATTPVNTDIEFTMNVVTPYTKLTQDIESTINVGNLLNIDIPSQITSLAAVKTNNEFISRIRVTNDLMPARVGIFVDPVWSYEPFVLKNAISTFFDRIMSKAEVSIVFGGSPRANWDIRHFADVYRIPKYHQHEVPFNFIPTHPLSNRDSMYRYINALFTFPPHSRIKSVDRVFVFSNNTYTHNSTYLSPLYKVCADYHIPLTVITSKGEFTGTDPASPSRFISRNPIDPNIPMDRQPHWTYGAGTKHRDIFDDHPIV